MDFFGSRIDVPTQRRFGDIDSVRRYVDSVLALPVITSTFPLAAPITVRERSGQGRAHYESQSATIAIPMRLPWAAREAVVLHEIAHHLACSAQHPAPPGSRRQWHGLAFRQTMCGLVQTVLGEQAALMLRAGYEEAGLRTVGAS